MCIYPKLILNRKYKANKKNGGVIPAIKDQRTVYVPIGCQECIECRKQKARGWQIRLLEDIRHNRNGKFITLTFSNEEYTKLWHDTEGAAGYEKDNAIATLAMRRFLERWRKEHKKSLRHWMVTEVGHKGTENIHLHGIIWTDENLDKVERIWKYGFIWKGQRKNEKLINYVNEQTVNYIVKYISKKDEKHKTFKSKVLTSPGIGKDYINRKDAKLNIYNGNKTQETYRTRTGHQIAMPPYWRNKIYTDSEREQLWIQRLDRQERWVLGVKIDVSKDEKEYNQALWEARIKNARLGYGNGHPNWNREEYEKERRIILQHKRLGKL